MGVKNLAFEGEDKNDKIEGEDRAIKNEDQIELRVVTSNNLPFTVVIPRRQGSKEADNNTRRYNLRKLTKKIR